MYRPYTPQASVSSSPAQNKTTSSVPNTAPNHEALQELDILQVVTADPNDINRVSVDVSRLVTLNQLLVVRESGLACVSMDSLSTMYNPTLVLDERPTVPVSALANFYIGALQSTWRSF